MLLINNINHVIIPSMKSQHLPKEVKESCSDSISISKRNLLIAQPDPKVILPVWQPHAF